MRVVYQKLLYRKPVTMFNFSLLHTSARPNKWREIYDQWLSCADEPSQVQYVLIGDQRWGFDKYNPGLSLRDIDTYANLFPSRRCYVEGVNLAARYSRGRTIVVIADDQHPCQGWDTAINRVIRDYELIDRGTVMEYVIRVNTETPDEVKRNITVMPIVSRTRYQRLGYIFYPGYESMYADNDLSEHAQQDGVMIEAGDILSTFPHRHPFFTDAEMDEQYAAQNRKEAYSTGLNILNVRRSTKFGTSEAAPTKRKIMAVCLPGETFSMPWVDAWTGLLHNLFIRYDVYPVFCHSSNVHVTRGVALDNIRQLTVAKQDPDYVLWIDDDNPVSWAHVERLMADLEALPDADAIAGWCWIEDKANKRFIGSFGLLTDDGICHHFTDAAFKELNGDLIQVEFTGFPVVLMRRHTLELGQFPFSAIPKPSHPYGAMSEDTSFWQRAKEQGIKLYVDRRVRVEHLKTGPTGPGDVMPNQTSLPAAEIANPVSYAD